MKRLILLFFFSGLLNSCYTINNDTRFKIESFSVLNYDTIENTIEIQFNVMYYQSDKDTGYSSLEKGLKGSDDKVLYFGIMDDSTSNYRRCKDLNFKEFIDGFNNEERNFRGQRFDSPYKFCISSKNIKKNSKIILILENQNTRKTDTLKSVIF